LGKHARLNVSGSFYTSTADTLYLGETAQFNATHPEKSILSSAPPQAFGFLTNTPQPIHIQGSTLLLKEADKSLSVIGGLLDIDGTDSPNNVDLFAMGQINLISLASQGKVTLTPAGIDVTPETPGGIITINKLDISGHLNVGNILIHGGQLALKNSLVFKTRDQGEQGTITLRAEEIEIKNAFISNNTYGIGKEGRIVIEANNLTLSEGSVIDGSAVVGAGQGSALIFKIKDTLTITGSHIASYSSPLSVGKSANIEIAAHRVVLNQAAEITNLNASLGESGHIRIVADEFIMTASDILGGTLSPLKQPDKMAAVEIIADRITLENGARISNGTFGLKKGGDIILKATEELLISGGIVFGGSRSLESNGGKASTIYLQAPRITLTKKAIVNSDALSSDAGEVNIQANILIIEKGSTIQTITLGTGKGGSINITTDSLIISGEPSATTGIASMSTGEASNAGDAGEIKIKANIIKMKDKAFISTTAQNASGGDITIETPTLIHLQQGSILTNVKGGEGDGGNITIQAPTFMILNGAQIITQAKRGFGGDITIKADHFILAEQILSADLNAKNVLNASSNNVERSGTISTPTPNEGINSFIVVLPTAFLSEQLQASCASRTVEDFSDFKVTESFEDLPPPPEDLTVPMLY
jgi:lipopolysaccharide export system protein LptA